MTHTALESDLEARYIADVLPLRGDETPQASGVSRSAESRAVPYADIGAILDGRAPEPVRPTIVQRTDGHSLFYTGQVNLVFGDPESGKTWVCLAAVAAELAAGRRALMIDLDHNGAVAIVGHLRKLGVEDQHLRQQFRYVDPDHWAVFDQVVLDMAEWKPSLVVVDSLGELIPLYGRSSISPDDVTHVHRQTLKPLAQCGAAVIAVDHLSKGEQARGRLDPGGTLAKSRVLGGASYKVTLRRPFAPGQGGACELFVAKDRHGGVRAHCAPSVKPSAGIFELMDLDGDTLAWQVVAPSVGQAAVTPAAAQGVLESSVEEIVAAAERTNAPRNFGRERLRKHLLDNGVEIKASNDAFTKAAKHRKDGI